MSSKPEKYKSFDKWGNLEIEETSVTSCKM